MGTRLIFKIDCTIRKPMAVALRDFCDAMSDHDLLSSLTLPLLRKLHDVWPDFTSQLSDSADSDELASGVMRLNFDGKYDEFAFAFFIKDFLPETVTDLSEFVCLYPDLDEKVTYTLKSGKLSSLTSKVSDVDAEIAKLNPPEEAVFVTVGEWRENLITFLAFMADTNAQKRALLDHDLGRYASLFDNNKQLIWFDVHTVYMDNLGMENGVKGMIKEGFLTKEMGAHLKNFDTSFQKYLPDNLLMKNARPILSDMKWMNLCHMAEALLRDKAFINEFKK